MTATAAAGSRPAGSRVAEPIAPAETSGRADAARDADKEPRRSSAPPAHPTDAEAKGTRARSPAVAAALPCREGAGPNPLRTQMEECR